MATGMTLRFRALPYHAVADALWNRTLVAHDPFLEGEADHASQTRDRTDHVQNQYISAKHRILHIKIQTHDFTHFPLSSEFNLHTFMEFDEEST